VNEHRLSPISVTLLRKIDMANVEQPVTQLDSTEIAEIEDANKKRKAASVSSVSEADTSVVVGETKQKNSKQLRKK
jgi:4-hydroxy-3-methylbut-2-enyl diphosphate reductase IspH